MKQLSNLLMMMAVAILMAAPVSAISIIDFLPRFFVSMISSSVSFTMSPTVLHPLFLRQLKERMVRSSSSKFI